MFCPKGVRVQVPPRAPIFMIADKYVYLLLSLGFFVPALLMLRRREWRKPIVAAGLVGAAAGLFAEWLYFVDYWRPPTLRGIAATSPEDALFGFGVAALALCIYLFFEGAHPAVWKLHRKHALHVVTLMVVVLGGWIVLTKVAHLNSMVASYIVFLITPTFLLVRRPYLWRMMLVSGFALALIGGMVYAVLFGMVSRDYIGNYFLLTGKPWNPTLFGFYPIAEAAWYFLWAFSVAGVYPYVFEGRERKIHD